MARGARSSARLAAGSRAPPLPRVRSAPVPGAGPGAALGPRERRQRAAARACELEDPPHEIRRKCRQLARAIKRAKHIVVYTGAGISTAADIPDYRGPRGVWTRLQRGEQVGRVEVSRATPTYTHMALAAWAARGGRAAALRFVVSQNCDGLHLRAGLPRRQLAELHGDMFLERCSGCGWCVVRAFDVTQRTRRHRHGTRRLCPRPGCRRALLDTIVHFGERGAARWPLNWPGALRHAARADLILCLGSSLKVLRRYPRLWSMQRAPARRPPLYIVNLQWTPKDAVARLKIHARCDAVMRELAARLHLRVRRYRPRDDPLLAHATPLLTQEEHTTTRPILRVEEIQSELSGRSASVSPARWSSSSSSSEWEAESEDDVPLKRLVSHEDDVPLTELATKPPPASDLKLIKHEDDVPLTKFASRPRCDWRGAPLGDMKLEDNVPLTKFASRLGDVKLEDDVPLTKLVTRPWAADVKLEDDVPLQLLAARKRLEENGLLRGGARRLRPEGAGLHAFTVQLASHSARILLLAAHAPLPPPPPAPPPPLLRGSAPLAPLSATQRLRQVRISRATTNGHNGLNGVRDIRLALPLAPVKPEPLACVKPEIDKESVRCMSRAGEYIARALKECRGRLYSGLHTIVGEGGVAASAPRGVQCAWCWSARGAARCLWYPRLPAVRPRRAPHCTCCGGGGGGAGSDPGDDTGWYGKGYRKGRRAGKR